MNFSKPSSSALFTIVVFSVMYTLYFIDLFGFRMDQDYSGAHLPRRKRVNSSVKKELVPFKSPRELSSSDDQGSLPQSVVLSSSSQSDTTLLSIDKPKSLEEYKIPVRSQDSTNSAEETTHYHDIISGSMNGPQPTDEDGEHDQIASDSSNMSVSEYLNQHLTKYDPTRPTNYTAVMNHKIWRQAMPRFIIKKLRYKRNGFFIECGAFDGQFISNTLLLERKYDWTGLLIEADPGINSILVGRNRHAFVFDGCLSPKPYPMKITMTGSNRVVGHGYIENKVIASERTDKRVYNRTFDVRCYPLHQLLDKIGRNTIDYFSLDVEGVELDVLKTIPWDRIHIKLISVEVRPDNKLEIEDYLTNIGYKKIKEITVPSDFIHDHVYEFVETANSTVL